MSSLGEERITHQAPPQVVVTQAQDGGHEQGKNDDLRGGTHASLLNGNKTPWRAAQQGELGSLVTQRRAGFFRVLVL